MVGGLFVDYQQVVPNYVLAGGQVVSSHKSVSRDPLSAQVAQLLLHVRDFVVICMAHRCS